MSNEIAIRIGRNIATARKAANMTQAEVAEQVGIEIVSLSRIERGVVTPGVPTLDRIADALGIALGRLFDGASSNTATLADNIISQLEPLSEDDRLFLLHQLEAWAEKLRVRY